MSKRKTQLKVEVSTTQNEKIYQSAAILWILCFLVYYFTSYPSVAGGDSGELIVVANSLGVAHPPGYPLYTLIGKLACLFPFGSVAQRMNWLSGVFDASAAMVLFLSVARWTKNLWAGFLSAGMFAFSPWVWSYATTAEVFSLNNLLNSILIFLSFRYFEKPDLKWIYVVSLILGLGLANHQTLMFFGIPLIFWMLLREKNSAFRLKPLLIIVSSFLLGLSFYLYLPIASQKIPLWGWGDQTQLDGFLKHFFREEYGTFQLVRGVGEEGLFLKLMIHYLASLPEQFVVIGIVFLILGLYYLMRSPNRSPWVVFWLFAYCFYMVFFLMLSNVNLKVLLSLTIQSRFYQQSNLILALWMGLGAHSCSKIPFLKKKVSYHGMMLLALSSVSLQILWHWNSQNQSKNFYFEKFGSSILRNLPQNALLLSQGDHVQGAIRYVQTVKGYRTDVKLVDIAFLTFPWSKRWLNHNFPEIRLPKNGNYLPSDYNMKDLIEENLSKFPIFVINGFYPWDHSTENVYQNVSWGFTERIVPKTQLIAPEVWREANDTIFESFPILELARYPTGSWEASIARSYFGSTYVYGTRLLSQAVEMHDDQKLLEKGTKILELVGNYYPDVHVDLFKNLGVAYQHRGAYDAQAYLKMKDAWRKYLQGNPPETHEVIAIKRFLGVI